MAVAQTDTLDELLQLLPACTRCRAIRKRCDTLLPACANCSKSGLQCTFHDSVSKEVLPREYATAAAKARQNGNCEPTPPPAPIRTTGSLVPVRDSYQFLGKHAPLSAAVAIPRLQHQSAAQDVSSACPPLHILPQTLIDDTLHEFLVGRYITAVHNAFPVFDDQPQLFLRSLRESSEPSPWQTILLKMVYSIACHCVPANDTRLLYISDAIYQEAVIYIESLMKDHRFEALQAIVLLAIRSIFDAKTGSIGQLVNFSHRLEVELSSHNIPEMIPALKRLRSATTVESQFLCSLYSWQFRRAGGSLEAISTLLDRLNDFKQSPIIFTTIRQICLLAHPSMKSATDLLAAYSDDQMVYTIFASHWIYQAGSYLIAHADEENFIEGCIMVTKTLDRCASKWPSAKSMQAALENQRRNRGR
ncbi:hypothetical protein BJY00DRAFT_323754 [Aspergillus carlsbadensis]|nr:hypothetical protein BJY00DRAFT_323754 [Aspergillus carlsbadensis]